MFLLETFFLPTQTVGGVPLGPSSPCDFASDVLTDTIMSNLQHNCCLEVDFQKVDQHTGCKLLIHDTKRRNDNQLQSLKLPSRIS